MQEKYEVLARKYRPKSFNQVLAQRATVVTLQNAFKQNKVAHAYLFTGPRGVGKTSLARLFAKALNCDQISSGFEPCNQCSSCKEINAGQSLDVIEIDGASNRGIDDIRQINETVGYAPTHGKYKIYIIDEVHMLTKEAFNALLKTLEEPPENVKFFFATTEPQKVLPTISSRCQRFDLLRISEEDLIKKLGKIAQDLDRKVEKEALKRIATAAEGSFRDAESLLDQVLCYSEETITLCVVNEALGFIDRNLFFDLDRAVWQADVSFAFSFTEKVFQSGKDLVYLLEELTEHYRQVLVAITNSPKKQQLDENYLIASEKYTSEQCLYILELLLQSARHLHKSPLKRITIEMLLLQIIRSQKRVSLEKVTQKLLDLEALARSSKPINSPPIETTKQPKAAKQIEQEPVNLSTSVKSTSVKAFGEKPALEVKPIVEKQTTEVCSTGQTIKEDQQQESAVESKAEAKSTVAVATVPIPTPTPTDPPPAAKPSIPQNKQDKKQKSRYDTLMRFTAVELEGSVEH